MKALLAFSGALLLAGCGVRNAAVMVNPLASGVLQNNESHHRRGFDEMVHGLPERSLTSEASLASLDDRQACFDLRLRHLSEPGGERDGDAYVDLNRLVARLEVEDPEDFLLVHAETRGQVTLSHAALVGSRTAVESRDRQVCVQTPYGPQCNVVSDTYLVPVEVPYVASDGAGRVCFAHRGTITPETTLLVLELSHPAEGYEAAHRFAWRFPS
jgi:hypothetical protein